MAMAEIARQFPSLVVQDSQGHRYSGFIEIASQRFLVKFHAPYGSEDLTDFTMECDNQMASVLGPKKALVEQRLKKSNDLLQFLIELKVLLEKDLVTQKVCSEALFTDFYSVLMNQITTIGWDKVSHISSSLHELELTAEDAKQRKHYIKMNLSEQFPTVEPTCKTTLPDDFHFDWTSSCRTLQSVYVQFREELDRYQDFWSVMDDIDENTWILEPEQPTRADKRRRIAVASSASILVDIRPDQPRSIPEFAFLGPEKITEPLKEKLLSSDVQQWDADLSVLENIRHCLEIELPRPCETKEEEYRVECGICYSHLFEDSVPDCVCDNACCGQLYHRACICEWLRALPDSRQSFNIIFGECPYCSKPISTRMPASS